MPQPVPIPFPLSTSPGARPHEAAGRLINCWAEPLGASSSRKVVYHRSPGLKSFATTPESGYRGSIEANGVVYAAWEGKAYVIDAFGVAIEVGNLPGTRQVTWAVNNYKPTPDIQVVDVDNGAFAVTSQGLTPFTGGIYRPDEPTPGVDTTGNLPVPNSVCFQDGYFFWSIGSRQVYASTLNGVAVNTLTKATAESRSSGYLIRVVAYKGLLFMMGSQWIEIWSDVANPYPDFPYSRQGVLDRGLLTSSAIAGWEGGFGTALWVADDFGVYRFNTALQPEKVSPPDLDRLIERADPKSIRAGCYVHSGHSVWTVSSDDWSWEFSLSTEKWNERQSFDAGGSLARFRGVGGVNAFGRWLVGDTQSGALASIESDLMTEMDDALLFRLESAAVDDFPSRTRIARSDFDFTTGTGSTDAATINGQEPQAMISWSDDGISWSNVLTRSLGQPADGMKRITLGPTGHSSAVGRRWRIDISDPVYASVLGGTQSTNVRGA